MIGLLEASRNYDSSQGASFETYAGIRIRGSMLDEIRKGDWAPRSLHRKARQVAKAVQEIEAGSNQYTRPIETSENSTVSFKLNRFSSRKNGCQIRNTPACANSSERDFELPKSHHTARWSRNSIAERIRHSFLRERSVRKEGT